MNTPWTIRNLELPVNQLLHLQAASHKRFIKAESRDIVMRTATQSSYSPAHVQGPVTDAANNAVASVRGEAMYAPGMLGESPNARVKVGAAK